MFKNIFKKCLKGPLSPIARPAFSLISGLEYRYFNNKWCKENPDHHNQDEVDFVRENVTIIFKSFERQKLAKRLFENIQKFYPGIRVVIADDSRVPLEIDSEYVEIIHLPFNSGLCYGLNRTLERVKTPYVMRLDDDELLTARTIVGEQLRFLERFPMVDIVSFCTLRAPECKDPNTTVLNKYGCQDMRLAKKRLLIPHGAMLDEKHIVMGKTPNRYVARTEAVRDIGWDENVRMLDHHDFFFRAAGEHVVVIALGTAVFHEHNPFLKGYQKYREDVEDDKKYLLKKWGIV